MPPKSIPILKSTANQKKKSAASESIKPDESRKKLCDEVLEDLSKLDNISVDPSTVVAIALVVDKLLEARFTAQTSEIEKSLNEKVAALETTMSSLKDDLSFLSNKYDTLKNTALPALASHVSNIANNLTLRHLELETHRRKWNLILHGIKGDADEFQHTTRESVLKFAKDKLKIRDTSNIHIAACHRLSRSANAGIIIRFCDLSQRDEWMAATKNLKDTGISLSPDLPPKLRPIKNAVMLHRKSLSTEEKRKSKVRYLPSWPFVELKSDNSVFRAPISVNKIVGDTLGIDTLIKLALT